MFHYKSFVLRSKYTIGGRQQLSANAVALRTILTVVHSKLCFVQLAALITDLCGRQLVSLGCYFKDDF